MSFLVCTECDEEIGLKNTLSNLIHGKCAVCGEPEGRKLIYTEKARIKDPAEARKIVERFKSWNQHLLNQHEEETSFLSEVPAERLKPEVKKILHLRFGPKNVKCLYALETRRGIVFVHGVHHDGYCPAVKPKSRLKR